MRRKKPLFFFSIGLLNCHLSLFLTATGTRENCLQYLARPLGFRLFLKSLCLECHSGLHGSLQELGHVRIICLLHFDSKSMCFEVIIGKDFLFVFLVAAFENRYTGPWEKCHHAAPLLQGRHFSYSWQWHGGVNALGHAFRAQLFKVWIKKHIFMSPGNRNMPWAWMTWKKSIIEQVNGWFGWIS